MVITHIFGVVAETAAKSGRYTEFWGLMPPTGALADVAVILDAEVGKVALV
jgi:hypothetical protein